MAKYDGLAELLRRQLGEQVTLTFEQVADAIPGGLPPSACRSRQWWANEPGGRHVQAKAWCGAGWHVSYVDLAGRIVTFSQVERSS
jgi:hypothetical protein